MSGTGADPAPPRPRQVLVSGIVAAAACALLVLTLFDALTRMRSAEVRDTVSQSLAGHNDLGVSVSQVLAVMRAVTYVSGALAAAGVVLAIYALQRHRGARAGLSVVAVVLVFTATLVAGLLPLLVGLATLRLWSRDSRDWFDGRPARARQQRPVPADDPRRVAPPPPSDARATASWPSSGTPATPTRAGEAGDPAPAAPRPAPSPYAFGASPTQRLPVPPSRLSQPEQRVEHDGRRPTAVTLACRLTWVLCGLLVAFLLLVAVVLTGDSAALLRELDRNPRIAALGATDRELLDALWMVVALGITWALAAMALAALAYRRVDGARVALVVSAVLAALLGAPFVVIGWVHAAGAVTAAVLLLQRPAREWYADGRAAPRQRQSPPPPPPPPPPPALGPPPGSDDGGKPPVW